MAQRLRRRHVHEWVVSTWRVYSTLEGKIRGYVTSQIFIGVTLKSSTWKFRLGWEEDHMYRAEDGCNVCMNQGIYTHLFVYVSRGADGLFLPHPIDLFQFLKFWKKGVVIGR
jgi:hypothetical protein